MLVLGPHLILSVRKYHANLVADSDGGPDMVSITLQEGVRVSIATARTQNTPIDLDLLGSLKSKLYVQVT
jgi:hypothetical protein